MLRHQTFLRRGASDPCRPGASLLTLYSAAALAAACSGVKDSGSEAARPSRQDLVNDRACFGDPAATLTGGGALEIESDDPQYQRPGHACPGAYQLLVNDYNPVYDLGTTVSYDDDIPTTQADCEATELTVAVSARLDRGVMTLLGMVTRSGEWLADAGLCLVPDMKLERELPEFRANGFTDYNFAIRAERKGPDGSTIELKRFSLAALPSPARSPAAEDSASMLGLALRLQELPVGQIDPVVHEAWQLRGTETTTRMCRANTLARTLLEFSGEAVVKLGAPVAAVQQRYEAAAAAQAQLCGESGTELAFQDAIRDELTAYATIHQALYDRFRTQVADQRKAGDVVADMLASLEFNELGRLTSNCNLEAEPLDRFIELGTLPAAVPDSRLLLGECSDEDAVTVGSRLGVGGPLGASDAQASLIECLAPLNGDGNPQNICNDPRASGGSEEGTETDDGGELKREDCTVPAGDGQVRPCTDEEWQNVLDQNKALVLERKLQEAKKDREKEKQRADRAARDLAKERENRAKEEALRQREEEDRAVAGAAATLGKQIGKRLVPESKIFYDIKDIVESVIVLVDNPDGVRRALMSMANPFRIPGPGYPDGNPYRCGTDFVDGGWYTVDSTPGFGAAAPQLNASDRFAHCMCSILDRGYGTENGPFAVSSSCPTERDRRKQQCLDHPGGDDDRPVRPECVEFLEPAHVDDSVWRARICSQIRCPDGQIQHENPDDGSCSCIDPGPPVLGGGSLPCPSEVMLCLPESPEACLCQSGETPPPFGDNPNCRQDPGLFPGSLDQWSLPSPTDVFVHQVPSTSDPTKLLVVRSINDVVGQVRVKRLVTPTLYESAFDAQGTKLGLETLLVRAPRPDENVTIQLYCTNVERGLENVFQSQVRLNDVSPGALERIEFDVDDTCPRGEFRYEFAVQTQRTYEAPVSLGAFLPAGSLTAIPSAELAPLCPRPPLGAIDDLLVPVPNPAWEDLFDLSDNPSPTWTVSDGALRELLPITHQLP